MSETNDPSGEYRLDSQVGYILRLANQRHSGIFSELSVLGLTPTQFATLIRLGEIGACSQNQLGRLTAMDVATIKGVVERLKEKHLVLSQPDPNDKRRNLVSLSPKGASLIPELHQVGHHITEATLAPLSLAERRTFLKLLAKLA